MESAIVIGIKPNHRLVSTRNRKKAISGLQVHEIEWINNDKRIKLDRGAAVLREFWVSEVEKCRLSEKIWVKTELNARFVVQYTSGTMIHLDDSSLNFRHTY